jgi:hypothetical protein
VSVHLRKGSLVESVVGTVRLRCQMVSKPPYIRNVTFTLMGVPAISEMFSFFECSLPGGAKLCARGLCQGCCYFTITIRLWVAVESVVGTVRLRCQMVSKPPYIRNVTFTLMGCMPRKNFMTSEMFSFFECSLPGGAKLCARGLCQESGRRGPDGRLCQLRDLVRLVSGVPFVVA